MARKNNPLHDAIRDAVRDAIADEERAADRKARQETRRQERAVDAALAAADPLGPLRVRLDQIEEQLAGLKRHRSQGDALAARLIETLELERTSVIAKIKAKSK